jgi:hypothetical protein
MLDKSLESGRDRSREGDIWHCDEPRPFPLSILRFGKTLTSGAK